MLAATSTTNNVSSPYKDMLHTVTTMKLDEIKVQQKRMLAHYKEVKEETNAASKLTDKLRILYKGMQSFSIAGSFVHKDLENIESLIKQSETDPTISKDLLRHWINYLTTEITRCEKRWEYAHLFGGLLTEYLDNERPVSNDDAKSWTEIDSLDGFKNDDLDAPGASSTPESRSIAKTEYEQRSFVVQDMDVEAAKEFLETKLLNFDKEAQILAGGSKNAYGQWEAAREQIKSFGTSFIEKKVTSKDVVVAITSLLNNDLLNDEKKEILQDLESNETILNEFAAILTMMMAKVNDGQWSWPQASSSLVWGDVRPAVGGRHRIFLDYDLCTTIFLEFVGLRWSQTFSKVMTDLISCRGSGGDTSVWNVGQPSKYSNVSVEQKRATIFRNEFFLNILPKTDADAKKCRASYDQRVCGDDGAAGFMHRLLLLIATEAKFHQAIHKETPFTVVKTDLASFGQSLNHDLVLMVMQCFQVPEKWICFFRSYLEAPVTIDGKTKTCKQGTHIAHLISRVMGEMVLILMDLHVHRKSGVLLHRIHDDIWFWSSNQDTAVCAWEAMSEIASVFGLTFNVDKSGSTSIYHPDALEAVAAAATAARTDTLDATKKPNDNHTHKKSTGLATVIPGPAPLPQSPCEWGFLILSSDGNFHVNTEGKLGYYAESMRKKLASSSSVLVWVNVFNRYLQFFVRNFGNVSPVFGLKHIDEIMAALKVVYEIAFKGLVNGEDEKDEFPNPIAVVEGMIKQRFPALSKEKIPDAWFHWPITAGGLGIENPFINLMACRIQVERKTNSIYASDVRGEASKTISTDETYFYFLENTDIQLFKQEKTAWESKEVARVEEEYVNSPTPHVAVPFAEYSDWCKEYRERRGNSSWGKRFGALVDATDLEPAKPESTPELNELVEKFINRGKQLLGECDDDNDDDDSEDDDSYGNDGRGLKPYWRWVLCFYGPALMEAFGSLEFMNTELIPMGMIGSLKSQGVPWD